MQYMKRHRDQLPQLTEKLKRRAQKSHEALVSQFPHVAQKLDDLNLNLKDLRRHSAKMISAAALAGTMLATSPGVQTLPSPLTEERVLSDDEVAKKLQQELTMVLPSHVMPLSPEIETKAQEVIQKTLGISAVASLHGNHLNTTYGYIGAEQHLPRYPGDDIDQHDQFLSSGITPGKGAWGYFAYDKAALTHEDVVREKYYVAVQTLYLPNWKKDLRYLRDWYKYRKVLVVNPKNGKSIVADIADAGPAAWTGKHFGGSPEVMAELKLNTGKQKGAVLLFFIDDQDEAIALGPITPEAGTFIAKK